MLGCAWVCAEAPEIQPLNSAGEEIKHQPEDLENVFPSINKPETNHGALRQIHLLLALFGNKQQPSQRGGGEVGSGALWTGSLGGDPGEAHAEEPRTIRDALEHLRCPCGPGRCNAGPTRRPSRSVAGDDGAFTHGGLVEKSLRFEQFGVFGYKKC